MAFHYSLRDPAFVFYSAHFIVKDQERESLHGHSYRVELSLTSSRPLEALRIGAIRLIVAKVCSELSCKFLLPAKSQHLSYERIEGNHYQLKVWGKPTYVFPIETCLQLPLAYSSAEMLSEYILDCLKDERGADIAITVGVFEKEGQGACCKL